MRFSVLVGGLLVSAYFLLMLFLAYNLGGDAESMMVISQLTNPHVTIALALVENFLPLFLVSNYFFQLLFGLALSFGLGAMLGEIFLRITSKKDR